MSARTLALAILTAGALASCAQREPVTLECSVDDTLVFVAPGTTRWFVDNGTVHIRSGDGDMARRMEVNETCVGVVL